MQFARPRAINAKLCRAYRKARRSPLPAEPFGDIGDDHLPLWAERRRHVFEGVGVAPGFLEPDDVEREITAARQAMACQFRFGESFAPALQLGVRSLSA